ncbi:heavy metal transporter [Flavobacteriaceae bacterium R38]|nr:heavy metal transporter [Flavobacteriaceae bacterium R38]
MQQVYRVNGMTCNGCRNSVEDKLNTIEGVQAEVNLEKAEVAITTTRSIDVKELQDVLPSKYHIFEQKATNDIVLNSNIEEEKSTLKQLYPLFLIFFYITVAAVLLNAKTWDVSSFMLDFMGLFYIVFSFFKMLDLKGFPNSFRMYDPLAARLPVYAIIYPFIETALGVLFLMRFQIPLALWVTVVILGITTIGVTQSLLSKKSIQCACLGTALKLPMTKATFIENSIMLIMAFYMLINIYI